MRKVIVSSLAVAALAAAMITLPAQQAEARRGHGLAAGIAAVIIGGVLLHGLSRRHHRRYYYDDYYAYPGYYYYSPRIYRYRSHRHHRRYYRWRRY
jgi:hypothetical protein